MGDTDKITFSKEFILGVKWQVLAHSEKELHLEVGQGGANLC